MHRMTGRHPVLYPTTSPTTYVPTLSVVPTGLETDILPPPVPPKPSLSSATADVPISSVPASRHFSSYQPPQPSEADAVARAFSAISPAGTSSLMGSRL